jgi:hypothetical protein
MWISASDGTVIESSSEQLDTSSELNPLIEGNL